MEKRRDKGTQMRNLTAYFCLSNGQLYIENCLNALQLRIAHMSRTKSTSRTMTKRMGFGAGDENARKREAARENRAAHRPIVIVNDVIYFVSL